MRGRKSAKGSNQSIFSGTKVKVITSVFIYNNYSNIHQLLKKAAFVKILSGVRMLKVTIQKNGSITLPRDLKSKFAPNEDLLVEASNDAILLKRTESLSLTEIAKRLKTLGREITPKEIAAEIAAYRSQK